MAKYPKIHTTNKGRELVSMANVQNKAVTYTKAVLGDGTFSGNIDTLTNIIAAKMECPFNSATNIGDGQFQLNFVIDNGNLQSGFYAREVGIFAKIDNGEEILFAYTNGGNYVDYIPDKSTPIDAQIIEADINIGDAESVTIVKSDSTYITFKDLENHDNNADAHNVLMTKHNTDEQAHDNRFNAIIQQVNNMITPTDDSDKQSLAPTLALVKTMLGNVGIVAQRLEVNGFVKFANGFTIQWGELTNGVSTFPVPFSTTVFFAVATSNTVNSTWSRPVIPMIPVTTLTSVSFTGYLSAQEQANTWSTSSFNGRYFCIGI